MAKTCMVLGSSGDGKSSSFIVPPNGEFPKTKENLIDIDNYIDNYLGLDSESTVIFNADGKDMPFPYERVGWHEGINLFTSTFDRPLSADLIEAYLVKINNGTKVKRVIIDTINGSMNDKEMLETRKMTYDKWADLAKDYYKLVVKCNSMRKDLIVYFFGHTVLSTQSDGTESKQLVTNGKKLEKIVLESKIPIVLYTNVELGKNGENIYRFETQKNRSSGKSPIGMFDSFLIPNSLKLVDDTIRKYYKI